MYHLVNIANNPENSIMRIVEKMLYKQFFGSIAINLPEPRIYGYTRGTSKGTTSFPVTPPKKINVR